MEKQWNESTATAMGMYDPRFEHDNCGIGAVVNIKGIKTHETVENALSIVENLVELGVWVPESIKKTLEVGVNEVNSKEVK